MVDLPWEGNGLGSQAMEDLPSLPWMTCAPSSMTGLSRASQVLWIKAMKVVCPSSTVGLFWGGQVLWSQVKESTTPLL